MSAWIGLKTRPTRTKENSICIILYEKGEISRSSFVMK